MVPTRPLSSAAYQSCLSGKESWFSSVNPELTSHQHQVCPGNCLAPLLLLYIPPRPHTINTIIFLSVWHAISPDVII